MESKQPNSTEQNSCRIAAFFDVDGTLMPRPSLERRYFRVLRWRRAVPARNYWTWLKEAVQLLPLGINAVVHANKMYLRGVPILSESDGGHGSDSPGHKSGHQGKGQASAPPRCNPRWPVPPFFPEAIERVARHAKQGHAIVLVSGTLEPLANAAARALEVELTARDIAAKIRICATRLEENGGKWTGRILDEAMFGEAKARAVRKVAQELKLDLSHCWAYGDSANDRWMLAAVGNPAAVNPSRKLARIARRRGWFMARWKEDLVPGSHRREGNNAECGPSPSAFVEGVLKFYLSSSRKINSPSENCG